MKSFAIVVVCYNRIDGVMRLISSLERVNYENRTDITLIFSVDNSGNSRVEDFAQGYHWRFGPKLVRTFEKRQGLKQHILKCGDYTQQYDIVVVLEDDLLVSNSMYSYAYRSVEFYWDDDSIAGISLYGYQKNWLRWLVRFEPMMSSYSNYFLQVAMSWGQVWTRKKWCLFADWLKKHARWEKNEYLPYVLNKWPESSWLKFHDWYLIDTDRFFAYPYGSLSTNFSDAGEHNTMTVTDHQVELLHDVDDYTFAPPNRNEGIWYDAYMERIGLAQHLNISEDELTVDIYGNKHECLYKRYVLTTKALPYAINRGFSLSLRPIEMNVIMDIKGDSIRLYDLQQPAEKEKQSEPFDLALYRYSMRSSDYKTIDSVAIHLSKKIFADIKRKIKKKLNMKNSRRNSDVRI